MELLTGDAVDLLHLVSHHPAKQVDAVDALVHQAPAVLGPGSPPGGLVIIVPVAVPAHMDGSVGEAAEPPRLQGSAGLLHRHVEAVLVAGGYFDALGVTAADDLLRVCHIHGHGLFDDNVHPSVDAVQGDLSMEPALRGDAHQGELVFREHLPVVGVALDGRVSRQVIFGQQGVHLFRQHVAHGDDLQAVVQGRFDVVDRDAAAADEGVFHDGKSPLQRYRTSMFSRCFTCLQTFLQSNTGTPH